MKKVLSLIVVLMAVICFTGCGREKNDDKKIVILATNYPGYDFARAVTKGQDNVEVKMLLNPGSEIHDFEPTPQDIINIKKSDMFIYVGGESDEWIEDILKDLDKDKTKVIKMMDIVEVKEEEIVEGMEEEHEHDDEEEHEHDDEDEEEHEHEHEEEVEYDEHVWTSPVNAKKIVNKLSDEIINLDKDNKDNYEENTKKYVEELNNLDKEFKNIVRNAKRKEVVFGDRFPLRYFVDEYGIKYSAAFPGCAEATNANPKTIAYLIEKVKKDEIPVVFKIELSNNGIADTIAEATDAKVLEFHSAHNISKKDFEAGVTYVDIMKKNVGVLKEALN